VEIREIHHVPYDPRHTAANFSTAAGKGSDGELRCLFCDVSLQ